MSSGRKDARWFLATAAAEMVGLVWDDMPYVEHIVYLENADAYLAKQDEKVISALADIWNDKF